MNTKLSISYIILIITCLFIGCQGAVKEENINNVSASPASVGQKYFIDTKQSFVMWKGAMLIGANSHTGYVYISKGELMIKDDELVGGTAEVDMYTIEEKDHATDSGLVKHLKDPDFFDVEKFPTTTIAFTKFSLTNSGEIDITGNLTIKGITHPVTFPAKLEAGGGVAKLNGRLVIDRTKWSILYKSGKFSDLLANEAISDSIEFYITIVAKKSSR